MSNKFFKYSGIAFISLIVTSCIPTLVKKTENRNVPASYRTSHDSLNSAKISYKEFFIGQYLIALIDTAFKNNQQLNITQQDIQIAKNMVRARKGAYLPFVSVGAGLGVDKVGRYTTLGAMEKAIQIVPGQNTPDFVPNYMLAAIANWQVDIWKQLRNARKSALYRYLSTKE